MYSCLEALACEWPCFLKPFLNKNEKNDDELLLWSRCDGTFLTNYFYPTLYILATGFKKYFLLTIFGSVMTLLEHLLIENEKRA